MSKSNTDTNQVTSPPPVYVRTPPPKHVPMSTQQKALSSQHPSTNQSSQSSAASSSTAVDSFPKRAEDANGVNKYAEWYPGDASHNGRPAGWNRVFCCGYGLGCFLCPCGSWTCRHERS